MTLLAALGILLSRYSGQQDLVIGSPIANRPRSEVEPLIGFFINLLALRLDLTGNPDFLALLQRVRRVSLDAYANQDIPFWAGGGCSPARSRPRAESTVSGDVHPPEFARPKLSSCLG